MNVDAEKENRQARVAAHQVFDLIWKQKLLKHRGAAYDWLRKTLQLSRSQAKITLLNKEQCATLVACVYRDFPSLGNRYTRILYDDLEIPLL